MEKFDVNILTIYNKCYIIYVIQKKEGDLIPPKAKITKEMITDAAFDIARYEGYERINARTVAHKLGCSTQPIMYHFATVGDIKKAVYQKADEFHSSYIMQGAGDGIGGIGMAYIRFAQNEKHLFRFLFQSDEFSGQSLSQLIDNEALSPVLGAISQSSGITIEQAKTAFRSLFLFIHGYASMLANNSMEYDEKVISADIQRIFTGTMCSLKEEL